MILDSWCWCWTVGSAVNSTIGSDDRFGVGRALIVIEDHSLAIVWSREDVLMFLWFTAFFIQTPNPYQYPIGKKVCSCKSLFLLLPWQLSGTVYHLRVYAQLRTLLSDEDEFSLIKDREQWVVGIMPVVTLVKLLLMLYCHTAAVVLFDALLD
ncbi:metal tolerance protein 11-like [Rosa rugosa]|uniref:metal tolerance protein 11-like n=1 Tax=Rosa rugosa TaxID=74645 RepID=UPI002B412654|nr:metal tolerance protein 11-like [Rosa rugosa]